MLEYFFFSLIATGVKEQNHGHEFHLKQKSVDV